MGKFIILKVCKHVIFAGSFELIPKLYYSPCNGNIPLIGRDSNICIQQLLILMENLSSAFGAAFFNLKKRNFI